MQPPPPSDAVPQALIGDVLLPSAEAAAVKHRFPDRGEPYRFINGKPIALVDVPITPLQEAARAVARPPPNLGKLSKRIKDGIRNIVEHGHSVSQAAEIAGCNRSGLDLALRRESGAAFLAELVRTRLAVAAAKGARRLDHLIDGARSEYVQLEAARTALTAAGYGGKDEKGSVGNVSFSIDLSGR